MLIKICGLTDVKTARMAALSGVNYIGLLFSKVSPRQIDLDLAKQITSAVRDAGAEVVGLFVDEDLAQAQSIIQELGLTIVQLHSDNARSYVDKLDKNLQIIYVTDGKELPACLDKFKDFLLFEKVEVKPQGFRYFIAGGLNKDNLAQEITKHNPTGIDLSTGAESSLAHKDMAKINEILQIARPTRYGKFGGQYAAELLIAPLQELEQAYHNIAATLEFRTEFVEILKNHIGRPTALTEVKRFAEAIGAYRVFLKREDLLHTGAHKINNAIGQCLLAKKMGKTKIVAETGAGQHGLASATACAMFGLECLVYMGAVDIERQASNVAKMKLLGAKVISVTAGSATLKDAVNEALRYWAANYEDTHYCLGSALGPYPFPQIVADFQKVIGDEAKAQFIEQTGTLPDMVVACVGGGSNSIGIFQAFIPESNVQLIGVEAGGRGIGLGNNAARFSEGSKGVLHGTYSYVLQTENGQVVETHSISAGLDYPSVGPAHAHLYETGRASYESATDEEALEAFLLLSKTEGIIPALESSHALAYVMKTAKNLAPNTTILINLSGRGDKDLPSLLSKELAHVTN